MSLRPLAAWLATSIAIISVTLHGCSNEEAKRLAADMNITNRTNMTDISNDSATTLAPGTPADTIPAATEASTTTGAMTTNEMSQFEMMEKGTCCCSTDDKIGTKEDCLSAMHEVKPTASSTLGWEGSDPNIPGGCSFKVWPDGTWHGHWNEITSGKARSDMIPVCSKADDERLRLFDDTIQGVGPSSMGVGFVACLSMGVLMAGVGFAVMRRGATWPVNRREVTDLILGDDSEPEE